MTEEKKDGLREWVEALRSGDYAQGRMFLRRAVKGEVRYCCLGVKAELDHGENVWVPDGNRTVYRMNAGDKLIAFYAPPELEGHKLVVDTLIEMNDCGSTFAEIADFIESQFDLT